MSACDQQIKYTSLDEYPTYEGKDLGMIYSSSNTRFRLWSPAAEEVQLRIYGKENGDNLEMSYSMQPTENGTWSFEIEGDLQGKYYTYQVYQNGKWLEEKPDIYSVAVGVNGQRSMIIDLETTNPIGWNEDIRPQLNGYNDIIIYEFQIRDMTIHPSSGNSNPGKYSGLVEGGTKSPQGLTTGIDHIKELGVSHVHLLPTFDHRSIDETKLDIPQYNWGYDPLNYNVPEGSFSSDPYDGAIRIREFKEMVQQFHANGIRVVLDVVYNHTGQTEDSNFNQLVPRYYYRQNESGGFSDASACGNETASERAMMRKYIVESVQYWVNEYHLDGFRFDLMGIHDIETMNEVSRVVREIDPSIFIYGEGWTAGSSPLPSEYQAIKANTTQLEHVAAFSDDLRDGLKGSVFEHEQGGFVSQRTGLKESIKFGVVASTEHPQIDYSAVNYSDAPWANSPMQTINYVSCHDNHTLWDKLKLSNPGASEEERIRMHKLALTIVLTSQGVPFLHAGTEFLRTKDGVENSFESPDEINQIDWSRKEKYQDVGRYVKGLIELRKKYPLLRMSSTEEIQQNLEFMVHPDPNVVAYLLKKGAKSMLDGEMVIIYNGSASSQIIDLPRKQWHVVLDETKAGAKPFQKLSGDQIDVASISAIILISPD